ncbi:GGDEF domain-containing protein [Marinobacter sp. F4206]|uniref:GGDEF domain-containing protein n=1 Tax=Marinobacter sp. F4206 TaxID=2861777 RepID=UPI001C5FC94B|nr:GGDEF domain-containing protein [Marinobacter sp. F4206]MBW4935231.1 GGDEF domain-containing protein [Marinobacter sp. F4206]
MFYRLKTDFRLSIITLLGASAILGITPFAIFRFVQGNLLAAVVDVTILVGIVASVTHAWLTGRTERSGLFLAVTTSSSAVVVGAVTGEPGLFWVFPCLVTSFFLARPRLAIVINMGAILALMVQVDIFRSLVQMWSFAAGAVVVSACAYVFAYRNESQRERLEHLATIDPLTGVLNRRSMDQELALAVASANRSGQACAIALLDLDRFKAINDEYGHGVGDNVLVEMVALIQQHTRRTDRLFRYGGEEFVLLLPGTRDAGLTTVLTNLQQILRKHLKHPGGPVTASFGVAQLAYRETVDSWLARADAALYEAKASGRDCIIYADLEPAQSETAASPEECSLT